MTTVLRDFDALKVHLKKPLQKLYLLVGEEPLALCESLDAMRQAAKAQGYHERQSFTAERHFNWQSITHFGQSGSLFASLRLLELNIPSGRPGVEGSKALQALAGQLPEDVSIVVILPTLDRDGKNSAWFQALEQQAVVLPLAEISMTQLPQWIAARLAQQQQQTTPETLAFLAHQVEGNLLAAHQEIQKLALLYPPGELLEAQVREAVLNVSRYDAFQLGEAVLAGDTARTVRVLQGLQDEGEQAVAVMNPLMWVIRPLVRIKQAAMCGDNLQQAMTQARIFGDRQTLVKRALNRLNLRQLEAAVQKLAEIDQVAKGVLPGDAWLEISRLCFGLAKVKSR